MKWIKINSAEDLPKKPGLAPYEQIDCLIWINDGPQFSVWNCEHGVWDDASGDDWMADPLTPSHYCIIDYPDDEPDVAEGAIGMSS